MQDSVERLTSQVSSSGGGLPGRLDLERDRGALYLGAISGGAFGERSRRRIMGYFPTFSSKNLAISSSASLVSGNPKLYQKACGKASKTTSRESLLARSRARWKMAVSLSRRSRVLVTSRLGGMP